MRVRRRLLYVDGRPFLILGLQLDCDSCFAPEINVPESERPSARASGRAKRPPTNTSLLMPSAAQELGYNFEAVGPKRAILKLASLTKSRAASCFEPT